MRGKLKGAVLSEEAVVRDKNVTTSRGVGTAIAFALELISQLEGEVKAHQIKNQSFIKKCWYFKKPCAIL